MHDNKIETLHMLHANLTTSVELFGQFLSVDQRLVPLFVRNQACMRRFTLCFIALFEYLAEASEMPKDYMNDKKSDELADFFIKKGFMSADSKEHFEILASIYVTIFFARDAWPDEEKIMEQSLPLYEFLKSIIAIREAS